MTISTEPRNALTGVPIDHTVHVLRLLRTLATIEANPEKWDQTNWVSVDGVGVNDYDDAEFTLATAPCGTAFCFAGWTSALEGDRIVSGWKVFPKDADPDYQGDSVKNRAQRLLGLTWSDQDYLFSQYRTLPELRQAVLDLCVRFMREHYPVQPPRMDEDGQPYIGFFHKPSQHQFNWDGVSPHAQVCHGGFGEPITDVVPVTSMGASPTEELRGAAMSWLFENGHDTPQDHDTVEPTADDGVLD